MAINVDSLESKLWPDFVTKAFIDIMVDEVTKRNMPNGVFHARTWNSMTTRLNSITNRSFKMDQLKTKMHRLRAMYREFYSLLQNTGFGWNAETNTVTSSEEVHEKASQFQKKGCDHYKLLEILFNKNNATGVLHHSSTQDPPNTDEENELDNQYLNIGSASHVRVDEDDSDDDIQAMERVSRSGKQKVQVISKKESTSQQMGHALAAWAQASLARAEKYSRDKSKDKSRDRSVEATSRVTFDCSLTKCVAALEEIEGIPDDIYGKTLEKFKDPDWREMFMAMSKERKRGWVVTRFDVDTSDDSTSDESRLKRFASNRFRHSTETISRNFKEVLRAVCRLGKEIIKQESIEFPERINNNSKYYPWFKNCIGAIDGTHISAWVPVEK
ncbi:uncharacterized protein [Cicer arietinum]|uniref:uncharacterized protein n=1 Tax=Cicer arietinum TaxID=3827 RepID=UPI003CC5A786